MLGRGDGTSGAETGCFNNVDVASLSRREVQVDDQVNDGGHNLKTLVGQKTRAKELNFIIKFIFTN